MMRSQRIIILASAITVIFTSAFTAASAIQQQPQQHEEQEDEPDNDNSPYLRPHVPVMNNSPVPLEIVWHAADETLTTRDGVPPGGTFYLRTYVGERFDVYELPATGGDGLCREAPRGRDTTIVDMDEDPYDYEHCWQTSFVISEGQEVEVVVDEDFEASVTDEILLAQDYAAEALEDCDYDDDPQQLLECLEEQMTASLEYWNSEWDYHHAALKRMGALLEPYVCSAADVPQETSPSLKEYEWESVPASDNGKDTKKIHKVQVLHQRPSSQIHVLENFISPEECQAVQAMAEPRLQRATVLVHDNNDERPVKSKRFKERQAWQASIDMNDFVEDQNNHIQQPLLVLRERMYNYASHALNMTLSHEGQERLESIQYFGPEQPRSSSSPLDDNDEENEETLLDRYESHCDGPCDGDPHVAPDRIATIIMYCEVPTLGGHTHFRNAGVHVAPTVGSAVFFSYLNSAESSGGAMETDAGLTEHTVCPVYEGSKKIVTQWIRYGVSEEQPWDSF